MSYDRVKYKKLLSLEIPKKLALALADDTFGETMDLASGGTGGSIRPASTNLAIGLLADPEPVGNIQVLVTESFQTAIVFGQLVYSGDPLRGSVLASGVNVWPAGGETAPSVPLGDGKHLMTIGPTAIDIEPNEDPDAAITFLPDYDGTPGARDFLMGGLNAFWLT